MSTLAVAVLGATGRMGRSVIREILASPDLELAAATARAGHQNLGEDAGMLAGGERANIELVDDTPAAVAAAEVVVDFSLAAGVVDHARVCATVGRPLVSGVTGLDARAHAALREAAGQIAIVHAPNMSAGVTVCLRLAALAAAALPDYSLQVSEVHHRGKRDAPSGTALRMGEAMAEARGGTLSRTGGDEEPGHVGFASLRAGDVIGEHTVWFIGPEERIELTHRALDRRVFVRGALRAARWLVAQPAGIYGMDAVLGL